MKLYTEDGDEVEAFTKEEMDAKTAELTKTAEEAKTALETKTAEFDKLSGRYEDKNTSYTELLKKNKEYESAENERKENLESTYSKSLEEKIKEIAGDDKDYAKALKKQLEREGIKEVTTDADKISRQLKEAKALTDIEMDRQPTASPIESGGNAPTSSNPDTNFTNTTEGKSTYEALAGMMGLPAEETK